MHNKGMGKKLILISMFSALLVLGALGTDADLPEYSLDISAGARRLLVHKAQVML